MRSTGSWRAKAEVRTEFTMVWLILFISGLLEVTWATALKMSEGFTRPVPSVVVGVAAFASFWLLAYVMRSLPLGTTYAVWTGIGVVGAFVVGVVWLGDALTPLRLISVLLILAGIVGLRLSEGR